MTCANCSKSIRTDNGMAFHLTWCKPAQPATLTIVRPDPLPVVHEYSVPSWAVMVDRPQVSELVKAEPYNALRDVEYLRRAAAKRDADAAANRAAYDAAQVRRAAAATPDDDPDPRLVALAAAEVLADEARARKAADLVSAAAARAAIRKAPAKAAKASAAMPERVGDAFEIGAGPNRVLVSVAEGPEQYGEKGAGARAVAAWRKALPKYRRPVHVDTTPTPDPLATSAAPIRGWHAPESGYPSIVYAAGAERGAGIHKAAASSWPRLDFLRATSTERKRRSVSRGIAKPHADPLATSAAPIRGWTVARGAFVAMGTREGRETRTYIGRNQALPANTFAEAA